MDYEDKEVIDWLRFGFTVSRDETEQDPRPADTNHAGEEWFLQDIDKKVETELAMGTCIGPFTIPPFLSRIGVSPLSTHP